MSSSLEFRNPFAEAGVPDQLLEEIADIRLQEVAPNFSIGYTLLNRHRIGNAAAIVAIGGSLSSLTSPDRAYEGIHLASLGRPVLMLDMPGHGLSSPHTRKQAIDLLWKRDLRSQVEPLLETVHKKLGTEDTVDYFGFSYGAMLSLKAVELEPADRVDVIAGMEIPGVKSIPNYKLIAGFFIGASLKGRRRVLKEIAGTHLQDDFDEFKTKFEELDVDPSPGFIKNNPCLFAGNLFRSPGALPLSLESCRSILELKSTRVVAITAGSSQISDWRSIESFMLRQPPQQRLRMLQYVLPNQDHNIGLPQLMPQTLEYIRPELGFGAEH